MKKRKKIVAKKAPSARTLKARAFFKRYWYWFVVLTLLCGGILGWCGGMGYLSPVKSSLTFDKIVVSPLGYYRLSDYVGKEKASYSVSDSYAGIISVSDGILYAKNQGEGKIFVSAGKKTGEIAVEVSPYAVYWTLGVGDEVAADAVADLPNSVYNEVNYVNYQNTDVFGTDDDEDIFVAKKKGIFIATYQIGEVPVCALYVNVKESVTEEERRIVKDVKLIADSSIFYDEPNVVATEEAEVGETIKMEEFDFSGSGYIYFESSAPEAITAYQDGTLKVNMPGNALITVACISETGMEYRTIKFSVPVKTVDLYMERDIDARNPIVGESITYDMLEETYGSVLVVRFETESGALEPTENGFIARSSTNGSYVYIDGLSAEGRKIVRYRMIIDAEADGE